VTATQADSDLAHLIAGAEQLGVLLAPDAGEKLLAFLDLLYSWNAYARFTAIERPDAVRLHLLDSLSIVPSVAGVAHIADLGSGAGFPGIPLATCLETAKVTLIESKRRRCSFLREAVRHLGLSNRVCVVEGDARKRGLLASRQDAVVARAFAPPAELLSLAEPLVTASGILVLMCGGGGAGELRDASAAAGFVLESERRLVLPYGAEARSIARFRRRCPDCFT